MRSVELKGPSRFRAVGRVQVNDENGRPFYIFDRPEGFTFTLPKGSYKLSGGTLIGRMRARNGHKETSSLRFPLPKRVELVVAPNPFKACISLPDGIIVIDPSLLELPPFCLVFVLFHEIGHYWYKSEEACDRFAAEEMHRRGYNPSQIELASRMTMHSEHRRQCNLSTAKQLDNNGR